MQLTRSSGPRALRSSTSRTSSSVASRIASASLLSTVVAPLSALSLIAGDCVRPASGPPQALELHGLEPARLSLPALADGHLHHAGPGCAHTRRRGAPVRELDALAQEPQRVVREPRGAHLRPVDLLHPVARVCQALGQLAVVGQQYQTGGVHVQAADRVEATA